MFVCVRVCARLCVCVCVCVHVRARVVRVRVCACVRARKPCTRSSAIEVRIRDSQLGPLLLYHAAYEHACVHACPPIWALLQIHPAGKGVELAVELALGELTGPDVHPLCTVAPRRTFRGWEEWNRPEGGSGKNTR